jgi:HlyD family secretion protein
MKPHYFILSLVLLLYSCKNGNDEFDATGIFETKETIISTEASGRILQLDIEEGQELKAGQLIGYIDSMQLYLKKVQLEAQIKATLSQKPDVKLQLAALQAQLKSAQKEQERFTRLVEKEAATQKQLDDVTTQVNVLQNQIAALQSSLNITSGNLNSQAVPLQVQIDQITDQLSKCTMINPVNGTVLTKYAEVNEVTAPGKALYKIADMRELILRAYVTSEQLSQIKNNQSVKVFLDSADAYRQVPGQISWISEKSEFTPKTIQTKKERANLVYAVKIRVKNDGYIKSGMYAEVKF